MTNRYGSATVPGIYFAGTIGQGSAGLRKYGSRPTPGPCTAHVQHPPARGRGGAAILRHRPTAPGVAPEDVLDLLLRELSTAPELWHQKSYLAPRPLPRPRRHGSRRGRRLAGGVRRRSGPDGVAITVETDDRGDIHPAVYIRRRGRVESDAVLDGSPLHDYRTPAHRAQLRSLVGTVLP